MNAQTHQQQSAQISESTKNEVAAGTVGFADTRFRSSGGGNPILPLRKILSRNLAIQDAIRRTG